jgi:hypothetical protein
VSKAISLNPNKQIKGSTLKDDFDGVVVGAGFEFFTYPGTTIEVTALRLDIAPDDGEPAQITEHYGVGNTGLVRPSADGRTFEGVSKDFDGVNDNTVGAFFFSHLGNCGYDGSKLDSGDVSVLVGERFHFKRQGRKDVGGKEKSSLVPTRYHGKATGASGNGAVAAGGGSKTDLTEKLQSAVVSAIVSGGGEPMTLAKLAQAVNKELAADPQRMEALKLLMAPAFLKAEGAPFKYDGKQVSV